MTKRKFQPDRLKRAHEVMAAYVERRSIPGLITLMSRQGETHVCVAGTKALDSSDPITRDSIFRITSMTKPITAVATLILLEECRLRLDEPVDRWLPELSNRRVLKRLNGPLDDTEPARRSITVRDLLTFRMGMGMIAAPSKDYPILQAIEEAGLVGVSAPSPTALHSPDEWLRRLGNLPLMHQPGERWMYNMGSCVLGVLIARVAGQPLESFLRDRIFDPLKMKDTSFSVPSDKSHRLVSSFQLSPKTSRLEVVDDRKHSDWSRPPVFPDGAAGLVSTIDDYLAFAKMLMNQGKHGNDRVLAKASIEAMTSNHLTPEQKRLAHSFSSEQWDSQGYGYGVAVMERRDSPTAPVGQYGWDGGYGTSWRNDPQEGLIGIILTQRMFESPTLPNVCADFWSTVYQAIDD